ncbi:MAG TPA: hypothetical protein V6D22_09990 [Candidatus Obscuribacterales bacterium]
MEEKIDAIAERNARVEGDKAWEVSGVRILSICIITYLVAAAIMYAIGTRGVLFAALLPVCGFYISAQSLPMIKKRWLEKRETPPHP